MRLFGALRRGRFIERPNRFVVVCEVGGRRSSAYLPNPGRLSELLHPGAALLLEESPGKRHPFTAVAVERDGTPVMLHTHRTNDAAAHLIAEGLVPGFEGARILEREVRFGRSRFDLLVERRGRRTVVEVKSCTLFGRRAALFPDAVTERGARHVEELAALARDGLDAAVLFIVGSPGLECFLPDYHTDPAFAAALCRARTKVDVVACAVSYGADLTLEAETRRLPVAWSVVERENVDSGAYLAVARVERETTVEPGGLAPLRLSKGFYVYAGAAPAGLDAAVRGLRPLRKRLRSPFDHLRAVSTLRAALAVRTPEDSMACMLARGLRALSDRPVPGFGPGRCPCASHLFFFEKDPMNSPSFHDMLIHMRIERHLREP